MAGRERLTKTGGSMKDRVMMRTFYNDLRWTRPHAGEPKAVSPPAPDGTDGTDTNSQHAGPDKAHPDSQGSRIVDLVLDSGAELFHDLNDRPYITIPVNGHRETLPVDRMGMLAGKVFYDAFRKAPGNQAVHEALGLLSGKAL